MMGKMEDKSNAIIWSAVITPHCSLSSRGMVALLLALGALGALISLRFMALGAWPVVVFMALDIALVAAALRYANRRRRAYEYLWLDNEKLGIERGYRGEEAEQLQLKPYWLRLEWRGEPVDDAIPLAEEDFPANPSLWLVGEGQGVEIASWLSAPEKRAFADNLQQALHRWRNNSYRVAQ